jgi:hypothetical protein
MREQHKTLQTRRGPSVGNYVLLLQVQYKKGQSVVSDLTAVRALDHVTPQTGVHIFAECCFPSSQPSFTPTAD